MDDPELRMKSARSWQTRLAALKSRYASEKDPRVIECRTMLAYYRVRKVIETELGHLSPTGVDMLITQLKEAVNHP